MDNLGDIGICWRLGRQLAKEYGITVRLWVDDHGALAQLRGGFDQLPWEPGGLAILSWDDAVRGVTPGAVVIEAFACEPPAEFVEKMTHQNKAPLWINLEYLSAENWIEGCHGLDSPHPRLPLRKYFYFPGFTARSGGLIREANLLAERDAFLADALGVEAWWQGLAGGEPWAVRHNLSLFSYEVPELADLVNLLAAADKPVRLLVPEGRVLPGLMRCFGRDQAGPGSVLERGALRCHVLPFLTQPDYDRLLWACDLNVVRGEDSIVRAQWAGRPFVWHIYKQEADAHLAKLEAFLARYLAGAEPELVEAVGALHHAWNKDEALRLPLERALARLPEWAAHGRSWAASLAQQADLAQRLVQFVKNHL